MLCQPSDLNKKNLKIPTNSKKRKMDNQVRKRKKQNVGSERVTRSTTIYGAPSVHRPKVGFRCSKGAVGALASLISGAALGWD